MEKNPYVNFLILELTYKEDGDRRSQSAIASGTDATDSHDPRGG